MHKVHFEVVILSIEGVLGGCVEVVLKGREHRLGPIGELLDKLAPSVSNVDLIGIVQFG